MPRRPPATLDAGEPEDVDRARRPRRARAGRRRPPRRRSRAPSAPRRRARSPRASNAASAEEWVQPEPCAAPVRVARPVDPQRAGAVDEHVGAVLGVAAGDDHRVRARAPSSASPSSTGGRRSPSPESARASGRFGVTTRRPRQDPLDQRRLRRRVEQRRAALGDHHRVDDHRHLADQLEPSSTASIVALVGEHPDLDRVDADVGGDRARPGRRSSPAPPRRPSRPRPCSAR